MTPTPTISGTNGKAAGAGAFIGKPKAIGYAPKAIGYTLDFNDQRPFFRLVDVERMRRDPQISFALRILRSPLKKVKFSIRASSPEVGEFVTRQLKRIWKRFLTKLCKMFAYGYSPGEWVYGWRRGSDRSLQIVVKDLIDFHPFDAAPLVYEGQLVGLQVKGIPNENYVRIGSPRFCWVVNDAEYNSYYGRSRLLNCWTPWMEKTGRHGALDIRRLYYLKNAFSGRTMRHPPGMTETAAGPRDNQDIAREIAEKMETGGIVTFDTSKDEGGTEYAWKLEEAKLNGAATDIRDYPKDLDKEILLGANIPPEVVEASGSGGSGFAGRRIPAEVFYSSEDEAVDAIVMAADKQCLRPMVTFNFGADAWYEIEAESLVPPETPQQGQQPPGTPPDGKAPPDGGDGSNGDGSEANKAQRPMNDNPDYAGLSQDFEAIRREAKRRYPLTGYVMLASGEWVEAIHAPSRQYVSLSAEHAPAGGVTVRGKKYKGGEFIPGDVVDSLTGDERKALDDAKAAAKDKKGGDEKPPPVRGAMKNPTKVGDYWVAQDGDNSDRWAVIDAKGKIVGQQFDTAAEAVNAQDDEAAGPAANVDTPPKSNAEPWALTQAANNATPSLFDSPRAEAEVETAAAVADPNEYIYARESDVPNAGADLWGSARHKRNEWRGLEDAEENGTAAEAVTRAKLFKNEPMDFHAGVDAGNGFAALTAYYAMNKFPADPGADKWISKGTTPERKAEMLAEARKRYYDAYKTISEAAQKIAIEGGNPADKLKATIKGMLPGLRQDAMKNAALNGVYNGLVKMHNSVTGRKTGALAQAGDFMVAAMKAYGPQFDSVGAFAMSMMTPGGGDAATKEKVDDRIRDVLEGKSINKAFGTVEKKDKEISAADMYVKHAERKGGRAIDAKTVKAATNFMIDKVKMRGVQFGNSMTDDERAHHLTFAAESFADLADVTGLDDSDISRGGKLGVAFGARGRANALAHYEPGLKVINLTRAGGVGSLAHEWGHALDNEVAGGGIYGGAGVYQSEKWGNEQATPAAKAFIDWNAAVRDSGFYRRLADNVRNLQSQGRMSKGRASYWMSRVEMFARTFERYVQKKLHDQGRENTYLTGLSKSSHDLWPNDAEVDAMAPAFEAIFKAHRERKTTPAVEMAFSESDHPRDDDGQFTAALGKIAHGDRGIVGGHSVRRLDAETYRLETEKHHVTGDAATVAARIKRNLDDEKPDRKRATAATERAEAYDEPNPFTDPDRFDADAAAMAAVPKGTRAVSLDPETSGRLGTVHKSKDDAGNTIVRLVIDGAPDVSATDFEPLDPALSWRSGRKAEAKAPAPVQATLFSHEGKGKSGGRWITIGGNKGADGKRKGGSPVYIENGRITKGAPSLTGKRIDALDDDQEIDKPLSHKLHAHLKSNGAKGFDELAAAHGYKRSEVYGKPNHPFVKSLRGMIDSGHIAHNIHASGFGEPWFTTTEKDTADLPAFDVDEAGRHRRELNQSRQYARAVAAKKARAEGLDPRALHQLAAEVIAHDRELSGDRKLMLQAARKTAKGYGVNLAAFHLHDAKGNQDAASIKRFDEIASAMASEHPLQFQGAGDDLPARLYELLAEGNPKPIEEADAYEQAVEQLRHYKQQDAARPHDGGEPGVESPNVKIADNGQISIKRPKNMAEASEILRHVGELFTQAQTAAAAANKLPENDPKRVRAKTYFRHVAKQYQAATALAKPFDTRKDDPIPFSHG